jgi:hypothetical protein
VLILMIRNCYSNKGGWFSARYRFIAMDAVRVSDGFKESRGLRDWRTGTRLRKGSGVVWYWLVRVGVEMHFRTYGKLRLGMMGWPSACLGRIIVVNGLRTNRWAWRNDSEVGTFLPDLARFNTLAFVNKSIRVVFTNVNATRHRWKHLRLW